MRISHDSKINLSFIKDFFLNRSKREQVLILTALAFFVVFLILELIYPPVYGRISHLERQLPQYKSSYRIAEVKANIKSEIEHVPFEKVIKSTPSNLPIFSLKFEFESPSRVNIVLTEAPIDPLILWLQNISLQKIHIDTLNIDINENLRTANGSIIASKQ